MKFGALPMYVMAPMNTAPVAIAARRWAASGSRTSAAMNGPCAGIPWSPAALAANARYVGALSSTLEGPRRPEELRGVGHAERESQHVSRPLAPGVENLEHRRHRDEHRREQHRH